VDFEVVKRAVVSMAEVAFTEEEAMGADEGKSRR
jgi:hypothetical protein